MLDTFVIEQVQTFALTVGLGLIIGFCFDFIRAVRAFKRFSRNAQFFLDLTFWLLMTLIVFASLLSSNWGEVRAYVFIGLMTGGLLYTLALSRQVYHLMIKVLAAIIRVVRFLMRPFVYLLGKIPLIRRWLKKHRAILSTRIKKIKAIVGRKKKE